ncbi:hypothetical protein LCGC14_0629830 [marine sediment metagenome]|uniref:Uncharacterized protein n=1 Tax=marine sediment metagenome TaxID=412755 RepID=A0A0F9RLR5_9ZZZZ
MVVRADPTWNDAQLREHTKRTKMNGGYATEICKGCGSCKADINGCVESAKIVKQCSNCWNNEHDNTE